MECCAMPSLEVHLIAERNHRIMNPLSEATLLRLGEVCRATPRTTVLDLACGKGEMLCRWSQTYGISGVGVDYFQAFLDIAYARSVALAVTDRLTWVQGDAAQYQPTPHSFDVASCLGATWIGGGIAGTINLLKAALKPDGFMLIGEPFWEDGTPDEAYPAWDMTKGEYVTLPETLARLENAGMELVDVALSTQEDWDRYEAMQWMAVGDYLRENPDDPTAREAWEWKAAQKRSYFQYARRYFRWGVFVLRNKDF
jgi:SAM-dependent methyltransferase